MTDLNELADRVEADDLLVKARNVYWSYTLRVKGLTDDDWAKSLMAGEFDRQHGVQIALEALRSKS